MIYWKYLKFYSLTLIITIINYTFKRKYKWFVKIDKDKDLKEEDSSMMLEPATQEEKISVKVNTSIILKINHLKGILSRGSQIDLISKFVLIFKRSKKICI